MNNAMQLLNLIKGKRNPKEMCLAMIKENTNPMLKNLVEMAENGKIEELKQFGRNLFQQSGKDFDKEYAEFMKNIK